MEGCLAAILIGLIAGYVAGKIMKGGGLGCLWNVILGVIGGLVGNWLFTLLDISWGGLLGQIGTATVGAIVILWMAGMIKK